ncbi:hypothetical protein [Clostridium sardiniense]|uniref:hypothetical protein n=1 Tax=Clostridium sardiniense TaxID=29369 RepID=UPI003D347455
MNNLGTLLKYDLINSYQLNSILNREDKKKFYKTLAFIILMIIAIGSFGVTVFMYFNFMVDPLKSMNMLDIIVAQGFIMSVFIIFGTSIYKAPGLIFGIKDYDMLISLPIKPWIILSVKLINLILVNYAFMAISLIPALVAYFINTKVTFIMILNAVIMYLFIPLIPIAIASIFGFIFTYISSKVRRKNIFSIISAFIVVPGILLLSSNMESIISYITKNATNVNELLNKIYPPVKYYIDGIVNMNFAGVLKFSAISVGIFILFVILLNKVFVKINSNLLESYKKNNFKMKELKEYGVVRTLFNKEVIRYISKPIVILNTSIGMFLYLIMAIGILFVGDGFIGMIFEINTTKELIPLVLIVTTSLFVALSNTTSSSISLEGENFWILKSLPIETIDIFKSKIYLNLAIIIVPILIGTPILILALNLTIMESIWLFVIPILVSFYISQMGLIVNLIFPMMIWTSEVVVVKRSISVIIAILIGGLSIATPSFIYYWFSISNVNIYLAIILIILLVVNVILYRVLRGFGTNRLEKIKI